MARYKHLPVEVDAYQWDGTSRGAHEIIEAVGSGEFRGSLRFPTKFGLIFVCASDYIIKDEHGAITTCRSEFFDKTYESI
jgi:hypothetical protein